MPDAPSLNQDRFFRLVVAADLSEFSIARQFIQEIGHVARLSEARLFDFQVAVSEAIANALENARSEAELCVWLLPDRLVAEIASQGAFQPGIYEDSAQRRRVLGLPIMASLADQVHVSCVASGGAQVAGGKTHVSLTFFLEGHGEDSDQPSHSDHGEAVGGRDALLESLRQSEERFRQIFEDHNAVMLLIDPDTGAIVDSNVAAARFYGRSKDELRTMAIKDLNELPAEQVAEEYRRAAAEERNHFMFPHRAADGETRWVEVHSAPIDTRNGRLLFSTIYDITERKVGEAEQERLRQIEKVLLEELRAQNEELEAQSEALQAQNEKLQAAQEKTALLLEERSSLLLRLQHALVDIPRELPGVNSPIFTARPHEKLWSVVTSTTFSVCWTAASVSSSGMCAGTGWRPCGRRLLQKTLFRPLPVSFIALSRYCARPTNSWWKRVSPGLSPRFSAFSIWKAVLSPTRRPVTRLPWWPRTVTSLSFSPAARRSACSSRPATRTTRWP